MAHASKFARASFALLTLLLISSDVQAAKQSPVAVTGTSVAGGRQRLRVRNRTPFVVLIYVRNLRIGWLKPFATTVIRGFRPGRHRLYATSRYGSASWGPKGVYVPGNWTVTPPRNKPSDLDTALVSRIYRKNRASLAACDALALRRAERLKGERADFTIRVDEKGKGLVSVKGAHLSARIQSCYNAVTRSWKYPSTGTMYEVAFQHVH